MLEDELAEYVGIDSHTPNTEYDHTPNTEYDHTVATPPELEYDHTVNEVTNLGYDRDTAIAEMIRMIESGHGPSYNEAERMFGRPKSTVVGWVKAARREAGKP